MGADIRLSRFRQVALAAQRTPGYQESLLAAGFGSPASIRRIRSVEDALRRLPCVSHERLRVAPEEFHNPDAPPRRPQRLWCPIGGNLRVALAVSGFEESETVRVAPAEARETGAADADVVAAPLNALLDWAEKARCGGASGPIAQRAIIAFTSIVAGGMPETTRELLWRTFEIPVFEQWVGPDGAVLASECEAHDGLHVFEDAAIVEQSDEQGLILTSLTDRRNPMLRVTTGWNGELASDRCPCGKTGPRFNRVTAMKTDRPAIAIGVAAR